MEVVCRRGATNCGVPATAFRKACQKARLKLDSLPGRSIVKPSKISPSWGSTAIRHTKIRMDAQQAAKCGKTVTKAECHLSIIEPKFAILLKLT